MTRKYTNTCKSWADKKKKQQGGREGGRDWSKSKSDRQSPIHPVPASLSLHTYELGELFPGEDYCTQTAFHVRITRKGRKKKHTPIPGQLSPPPQLSFVRCQSIFIERNSPTYFHPFHQYKINKQAPHPPLPIKGVVPC